MATKMKKMTATTMMMETKTMAVAAAAEVRWQRDGSVAAAWGQRGGGSQLGGGDSSLARAQHWRQRQRGSGVGSGRMAAAAR